jgi:hypothetical protein
MDERDTWPELTYRFIEHFKWEPQHLAKGESTAVFREGIRKKEVPLNFLFNLLFHAMPAVWIARTVEAFEGSETTSVPIDLAPRFPHEVSFSQPDILLEGSADRVWIECKVDAKTDIEQIQKYLALHAYLNSVGERRRPWMLFVTRGSLAQHWASPSERLRVKEQGVGAVHELLRAAADVPKFLSGRTHQGLQADYDQSRHDVLIRQATWQQVGDALHSLTELELDNPLATPLHRMIRGFLGDLESRQLWAGQTLSTAEPPLK